MPGRPAYSAPGHREAGPRPVEPAAAAGGRESPHRARLAEPVVEGELLRHRSGYHSQSTQDFLHSRHFQADSAATQRGTARANLSASNRQALGLYLNNTQPEPRQAFTHGRSVDAFV